MTQVMNIFRESMKLRELQKNKEQEKYNNTIRRQTEKVMRTETDRTQLHQSSKSIFKDADVNSAREVMQKTSLREEVKSIMNKLLPDLSLERLTNLRNELLKVK